MLLADLGAEVLRVNRTGETKLFSDLRADLTGRGRRSVMLNLKAPEGAETLLRLVEKADALIEGFRPGVTERLGIGPDVCLKRNPRLVYGRATGWGQEGPISQTAGHDINYIALTGLLHSIMRQGGRPIPPLNLAGDYAGGALYLAVGILSALLERQTSGKGQVIDAAMIDGAISLMTVVFSLRAAGSWNDEPGTNILDTGAPFYGVYETRDGKFVAIGAIEPQFYAELIEKCGLADEDLPPQNDKSHWPAMKKRFEELFLTKTRAEWCDLLDGGDACFAPVLTVEEAPSHPHNRARKNFVEVDGMLQPAPAPRFSRTPASIQRPPAFPGEHTDEVLREWGFSDDDLTRLHANKSIA
jgi:alpha-methylacyl-CoA racemase